jgi:hypothetical protein
MTTRSKSRFVIVAMLDGVPVEVLTRGNDGGGEIEWRTVSAAQSMKDLLEDQRPFGSTVEYHIVKAGRA